ncbi:hypothetical protein C173_03184 [Paenibacillus sp. FSL R7-277]|nr:hypothetical protein C173_03184 [Paenibacillus sp. FSL R7-277]
MGDNMKKILLPILLIMQILLACSNNDNNNIAIKSKSVERPLEIEQVTWEASIQLAISANEYKGGISEIDIIGLKTTAESLKGFVKQTDAEQKLINAVDQMVNGKYQSIMGSGKEIQNKGVKDFEVGRENVVSIVGEDALNPGNLRKDFIKDLGKELKDPKKISYIDDYMKENRLKARDVQFDMENNLDKNFVVEGTATLDDYYNYGFGNEIEDIYFCARVVPDDGSDSWYLYFERRSFKDLFEALKSGSIYVSATSEIPSYKYVKGQGNMAQVREVEFK